jgi:hypothetical protein
MSDPLKFDVFLCHNSQDKPLIIEIADALRQRKLNPWIDKKNIDPGEEFQAAIEQAIPQTKSAAIFFSLNGIGKWQREEINALQREKVNRGILLIPILLPGVQEIPRELVLLQGHNYLKLDIEKINEEFLDALVKGVTKQNINLENDENLDQLTKEKNLTIPHKQNTSSIINKQKVANLLCSLNYQPQSRYFEEKIQCQSELAFIIQAPADRTTQDWLVRRLTDCVSGSKEPRTFSINFKTYARHGNFEEFWSDLKLAPTSDSSIDSVIQDLTDLCKTKPVIIIMRELHFLNKQEKAVTQIYDFWFRLFEKVRLIPQQQRYSLSSYLVLLMVTDNFSKLPSKFNSLFNFIEPTQNTISESHDVFLLSPMQELSLNDVRTWLRSREVAYTWEQYRTDEDIQDLVYKVIPNYSNWELKNIMDNICIDVFNIDDGICNIENYWKLAG